MRKRGEKSQPISICQRFMNLIFGILSHPTPCRSVEVPIEEGSSRNNGKSSIRPSRAIGSSGASEIVVQFGHIGALENWKTPVDDFGSSIHVPKKVASSFPASEKSDVKAGDNGLQHQGRSQERNPVAYEQKNDSRNKESTNLLAEGTKLNKPNEDTKPKPLRRPQPLLSADSNINAKAESFIKTRKEAMGRDFGFDPKKD
ncbi:unnamed protein product [Fraxinus pennsylvanica]|uniref:Uncharacterized protein n=1 Tax=Fraxinus pennsylvanica TaxID=56036 RepID=A0AAD2EB16_9LAMI|nr:unnamed protein product [Fraxinus pennsylvanica]